MIPEHTALVAQLQKFSDHMYATSSPEAVELIDKAAAAICALAGEVEEQEKEAEEQQDSLRQAWAERDTLRAEVAALKTDNQTLRDLLAVAEERDEL